MNRKLTLLAPVALLVIPTRMLMAEWMEIHSEDVPVERLVKNLEAQIATAPVVALGLCQRAAH